jgi:O-antigen/teichoic acid export membrane protein
VTVVGESESDDDSRGIESIKTVASGGALRFVGKLSNLFLGLAVQIAMARLLVTSDYGGVTLAIAVLGLTRLVAMLGIQTGVSRLYPVYEDEPAKARGVVRAAYRISTVAGLVVAIALFLSAPVLAERVFDDGTMTRLIRIVAVFLPFGVLAEISVSITRAARDARPKVFIDEMFRPVARFVLIVALVYAGFRATGAVAGHMLAYAVTGLLLLAYVYRSLPDREVSPEPMDRELFVYSLPLLLAGGLDFLMHNIDTFMIGYFLTSERVGIYNVSYQLGTFAIFFLAAGGYLLPPMLAKLDSDGKTTQMDALYRTITKWIVFASAPVVFLLFVYPSELIALLFGTQYTEGAIVLQILVLGTFLQLSMGSASGALASLGHNRLVLYSISFGALVNVVLNVALIPVLGILGAGIATISSLIVRDSVNSLALYRTHRLLPVGLLGVRTTAVSAAVAVGLYAVTVWSGVPAVLGVALWAVVHGVAILLLGVNERDKEIFTSVEKRLGIRVPIIRRVISFGRLD